MTAHACTMFDPRCYRCDLAQDEVDADRKRLVEILLPVIIEAYVAGFNADTMARHADDDCLHCELATRAAVEVMTEW